MTEHTGIETLFDDHYSDYSHYSYHYYYDYYYYIFFFFGGWNGKALKVHR